ncbi:unnamed protein product [Phaeothamnion confervicola]
MNMNDGSSNDSFPLGDVTVNRTAINGDEGYVHTVTFKDHITNAGDQPMMVPVDTFKAGVSVRIYELYGGVRAGGTPEVQVISVTGSGSGVRNATAPDEQVVRGHWRAQFASSDFGTYVAAGASAAEVEAALEGLSTLGDVEVRRDENDGNGYDYTVTIVTPVGDRGAIVVDDSFLWSTGGDASAVVSDGNNAVATTAPYVLTCASCAPGETPLGYGMADLGADTLFYIISGLTPGLAYEVTVSAINLHGQGVRRMASADAVPPLAVPSPPMDVVVRTKPYNETVGDSLGDPQRVIVSFGAPVANGGAAVTSYLVEVDPTPTFDDPIGETFSCPNAPKYATWVVETTDTAGNISSGYFKLQLTRAGSMLQTDPIPFDAVATVDLEEPDSTPLLSQVTCENTDGSNQDTCPDSRLQKSGSLQMKLNMLDTLDDGVLVSRQAYGSGSGTYRWTVTFLDGGDDFSLTSLSSLNNLYGTFPSVYVWKIQVGVAYGACTGDLVVPTTGGLVKGEAYYSRVFAYNSIGFSAPATALQPAKPMTVPGRPTSVMLEVYDAASLNVVFSPPTDDGGDTIVAYLVEWSTASTFANAGSARVTLLGAGAPFHRVISGLVSGTPYYVRVSARNSLGYSAPQTSSPSYQHPYQEPAAPSDVFLGITSDTMLTVSFAPPDSDGGDTVTSFLIEWDVAAGFASTVGSPHRGSVRVDADERSYTIQYLSTGRRYYVRVSAANAAGVGLARAASPTSAYPAQQAPGTPVAITLSNATSGEVAASWEFPVVPAHGIPCYGTVMAPVQCPTPVGGVYPGADGGDDVYEYRLQWGTTATFSASDTNAGVRDVQSTTATVDGLTVGLTYFFRVAARNTIQYSEFCEADGDYCTGDAQLLTVVT